MATEPPPPLTDGKAGAAAADDSVGEITAADIQDPTLLDAIRLATGTTADARAVLTRLRLDKRLMPFLIPYLGQAALREPALRAIGRLAPRAAGQLVDALLDADTPLIVRRRLPRTMRNCTGPVVVAGLLSALEDREFEVRYHAARALAHIARRDPTAEFPQNKIFALAEFELETGRSAWESRRIFDFDDDDDLRGSFQVSLRHLFTVLSLALDREPLELAVKSLSVKDRHLRGTGLEYLEHVLPTALWKKLSPYVVDDRLTKPTARPRQAIVDDLMMSMQDISLDLSAVRKKPS